MVAPWRDEEEEAEVIEFWEKVQTLLSNLRELLQNTRFQDEEINSARVKAVVPLNFLLNGIKRLTGEGRGGERGVWRLEKLEVSPPGKFRDGLWRCRISYCKLLFWGIPLRREQEVEAWANFPSDPTERISLTVEGTLPDGMETGVKYFFVLCPQNHVPGGEEGEHSLGEIKFGDQSYSVIFLPDFNG